MPIHEGSPIFSILLPTFGNYTDATFATWEAVALSAWMSEGAGPAVLTSDVDLDPWPCAPLPTLGASGFFKKKTTHRITAIRTKHPLLEAIEYNETMSKNIRESTLMSLSHSRALSLSLALSYPDTFIVGFTTA